MRRTMRKIKRMYFQGFSGGRKNAEGLYYFTMLPLIPRTGLQKTGAAAKAGRGVEPAAGGSTSR